jgi:predicted nucleic acid-binding protein
MRPLSCLSESAVIALDASTAINLNATGCAAAISRCFSGGVVLPDIVLGEIEDGEAKGRRDAHLTKELIQEGALQVVSLSEVGLRYFEQLVVGDAAMTMDDGEAATIAYANETGAIAVIDERKANRICAERFPNVKVAATVDLFAHESVEKAIGRNVLADAVFKALVGARMRVLQHHVSWVVELIGADRVQQCTSLPRSARVAERSHAERGA